MKTLFLYFFIFFLSINFSFGQDSLRNKEKFFLLKYNPTSIFGDYITTSSAISLDIEIKIKKNMSYEQTFDYIFLAKKMGGMLSVFVDKIKGIRTDSEIKKYLNKKNVNLTGFYLSTHILYQYTDATIALLNNTKVFRNLFALHEKFGWQYISKNGFVFEVALGLGTRYTTGKTVGYNGKYIGHSEMSPIYWYDKPYGFGSKWFFSGTGDFKIGWMINFHKK